MLRIGPYSVNFVKTRFQEEDAPAPAKFDRSLDFTMAGKDLLLKAIMAAIQSSKELEGESKRVPLQGVIDLATQTIYIGALTPKDANAFEFKDIAAADLIEHKKAGLFGDDPQSGRYSPRLRSYQGEFAKANGSADGPTAHIQLLLVAAGGERVSASDAENKLGIALGVQVKNNEITIYIDGKSLSINQTGQYLRTLHAPGHTLSAHEARSDVLKASGMYSEFCESWVFDKIAAACERSIQAVMASRSKSGHDQVSMVLRNLIDDAQKENHPQEAVYFQN